MRVLVVTNLYPAGLGNWVAEQVRSLRDAGVDIDVFFFNTRGERWRYASSIPRIAEVIRQHRYDVIHTHHTYTMFSVLAARKVVGSRIPVILTNHEGEMLGESRILTWHPTSLLRNSLAVRRYAARRAERVIFVSERLATTLGFGGGYEVIPCGVDLRVFYPADRVTCRRTLNIPEEALVVFFPAAPQSRRKRFSLAREAFDVVKRRVPSALLIHGGAIQYGDMPCYYGAADVVVQTSYFEASPTIVKEALACEVPVVSTDVGDTRDVICGVPHCAVCSEDPEEIADRLLAAMGKRAHGGRERLLAMRLDLPQVAERIVAVYRQVVR